MADELGRLRGRPSPAEPVGEREDWPPGYAPPSAKVGLYFPERVGDLDAFQVEMPDPDDPDDPDDPPLTARQLRAIPPS